MKTANLMMAIVLAAAGIGAALYARKVRGKIQPLFELGVSGVAAGAAAESVSEVFSSGLEAIFGLSKVGKAGNAKSVTQSYVDTVQIQGEH